ncbi:glycoside hydrolase [Flavobacteriaceae bacterium F89]|uniref:Glycoside hydrolase n=1 Tax=Cerina litoralis TaxID=2874477 RepID=A0AAE3ET18_9FLAO|nr:glycoside hydrolase [Cerina litoralis]MCG2459933.1 glycoside hydrolase [Cerina litoralis]
MRKCMLFLLFSIQISCSDKILEKIDGVSLVASREMVNHGHVDELLKINANYVSVMPFGFIQNLNSPEIIFNSDRQWFGETVKGIQQYIGVLQNKGIRVMVKPQIWIWRGEFTGKLQMSTEEDWKILEESYEKFILAYAVVAQKSKVPLFCMGTELELFVQNRPAYWRALILKIREVYRGKLTYAANWDEYTKIPFWDELDYIGVDAYFPLSDAKTPTLDQLRKGWQKDKEKMGTFSGMIKKPILFTEFGYRSCDYTAWKPWLMDRNDTTVNLEGQANATQVIFEEFWKEEWFAGGFIWKWFIDHERSGGEEDNRFTPQNKPAEAIIREFYGKN